MPAPRSRLLLTTAALVLALTATGCGEDEAPDGDAASSIPASADFNQADVDFATDMVQHHAQALVMVDMVDAREVSPELAALAETIRQAQGPEIELMVDWLGEWDQPVPETARDHANAHGDGHGGEGEPHSDMPGMMTAEQLDALDAAEGGAFEQMWLEMMVEHHEGAIAMARTQQDDGEYAAAIELAATIEAAQADEIDLMEQLLG